MGKARLHELALVFLCVLFALVTGAMGFLMLPGHGTALGILAEPMPVIWAFFIISLAGIIIAVSAGFIALRQRDEKAHYQSLLDLQLEKQETQARYSLLFENSKEAVLLGDSAGGISSANPAACRMLGRAEEELCQLGWNGILDLSDQTSVEVLKLSQEKTEFSGEVSMLRADGTRFPVELYARLFLDENGAQHVGSFFRDITGRKRAEQELRFKEERFRSVFENSTAGVALVSLDGHYQMVNPAFCKIFGYTAEELLTIDFFMITHPDDIEISQQVMRNVLARKGETVHYSKRYIHRDGHTLWTEVNSALVFGVDGQPLHFITHINDFTERRRAEDALRASEERFRSLYENAAIGIYRTTPAGQILTANPAALRILGYDSFQELSQENLETKRRPPEHARSEFREQLEQEGVVIGFESSWYKRDGTIIAIRESANVIRDASGKALYYDGTFEDISEQKRAEQEVLRRTDQLTALHKIDMAIVSNHSLPVILDTLLQVSLAQLEMDAAAVLLLDPSTQTWIYIAGQGFRTKSIEQKYPLPKAPSEARSGANTPTSLTEGQTQHARARLLFEEGFVFGLSLPLAANDEVYGALEVYRRSPFEPTPDWQGFYKTLATQAVIAIDNYRLIENLQNMNARLARAYNDTLEGWSRALDLRDRETEGHSQRVIGMTLKIAGLMGIDESQMLYLRWGALLHDIGKIGIPDQILHKPSQLTDEEMAIMKRHPDIAYEMLSSINFLLPAIDIPYCHHEKWDGSGYPRRLKGEQIPLAARIFTIADVWDALCSDRPYRKGWTAEKARAYILEEKGRHFDPQLVDLFLKVIPQEEKNVP